MPKLQARYVPIGSQVTEEKPLNEGKSLKQIEEEAKAKAGRGKPKTKTKLSGKLQPLGATVQPIATKPEVNLEPPVEALFDDHFLDELVELEQQVEHEIEIGKIKLIVTNADQNMLNIKELFDDAVVQIVTNVDYEIKNEQKVQYGKELKAVLTKLNRLEQTIDYENYQNELRVSEVEGNMLRQSRYRKRKLEGLDDIGGIELKDHRTSEQQADIDLIRNTDFNNGSTDKAERRAFVQDYEGSDLEGIDSERDRLEQEILRKQQAEEKLAKRKSKKKTEEEKIAQAKARLRKKQEKRKAKQQKRAGTSDVAEIDLVGNQFDIEEMREEKMDRLLEIKKLSQQKKELQKEKEKQRTKASKEFYKYKKVNKKSHIVGFKQS